MLSLWGQAGRWRIINYLSESGVIQLIGKMNYGIMVLFACTTYGASSLLSGLILLGRMYEFASQILTVLCQAYI